MRLQVRNISKKYGRKTALDQVSFKLGNGVYGLLGPNGAGKSTLLGILVGVIKASGGEVFIDDRNRKDDDREFRSKVGYLPQSLGFYPSFSGADYLRFVAALKGIERKEAERRIVDLVEKVGLSDDLHRRCLNYSGGMKRRLGIAQALLNDPELLVLDEPTSGLDPLERIRFRNLVSVFSRSRTVLLSTHIVSDIDSIANQTIMIKAGKVGRMARNESFVNALEGKVWLVKAAVDELLYYQENHLVSNVNMRSNHMELRVVSDIAPAADAILTSPTLKDAYLYELRPRAA